MESLGANRLINMTGNGTGTYRYRYRFRSVLLWWGSVTGPVGTSLRHFRDRRQGETGVPFRIRTGSGPVPVRNAGNSIQQPSSFLLPLSAFIIHVLIHFSNTFLFFLFSFCLFYFWYGYVFFIFGIIKGVCYLLELKSTVLYVFFSPQMDRKKGYLCFLQSSIVYTLLV